MNEMRANNPEKMSVRKSLLKKREEEKNAKSLGEITPNIGQMTRSRRCEHK